jgi:sugar porter (SP) family MFS transporter
MSATRPSGAGTREGERIDGDGPAPPLSRWLWLVGAVILVAGVLFGYDQGVIAGALIGIEKEWDVSTRLVEVITSWVTLGALVGALVAGSVADRIGRRAAVLVAAVLFVAGAVIEAASPNPTVLVVGRLVVGFGVGVASVAAPLYAAEMAPTRVRGRFVSWYQFGITFGIFMAYLVDQLLSSGDRWRAMLGASAVPAVLLVLLILPLTDTPRWYVTKGRNADARRAVERIRPDDPDAGMAEIEEAIADDVPQASWKEVFGRRWRTPLLLGIGLAVFQQITGINAIIYYANKIFAAAGFESVADQTAATTWAIGAVNVLATLIAVAFVDRLGRRPLLLAGLIGMALSLTAVGFAFRSLAAIPEDPVTQSARVTNSGALALVGLVVYIASFAFSLGPVVWTLINEIFPRSIRGRGVSVATAFNWGSAWLVSQFFLSLTESIGQAATFWLFAAMCVLAFVWIWRFVPETRGRSLEDIEQMWVDRAGTES